MKKSGFLITFLCLLVYSVALYAQNEIKFSDLVFRNDAEKSAFLKFDEKKDTTDVFDLFFTPYEKSTSANKELALKQIDACVLALKPLIAEKSEVKKIKIIYDYVHKNFLKVYKISNSFTQIFENGEYNCLSATALYSIILKRLDIPLQIKETPTHVYLVAYPNSSKVLIETTDPQKGYYQFTNSFVNKYVTTLYNSKMITKEELESSSANDLFNKYFFTSENITIMNLAGLQFSNYALYKLELEDLKNANEEAKKAYFIFPNQRNKLVLEAIALSLISKNGYDDLDNVSNLALISNIAKDKQADLSSNVIKEEFSKIVQTQLIKNSDYAKFDKSYQKLMSELTDTTLKKEIGFVYHMELARLGYLGSKSNDEVVQHLHEAYLVNALDANMRALVSAVFEKSISRYNDSQSIMEKADHFAKKFSFFQDSDYYLDMKSRCVLDLAYRSYYLGELSKGDNYLKDFEGMIKKYTSIQPMAEFVERAYGQAASEYFKRGNSVKAKQTVKTGLLYAPNSFGLQQRLAQLK
ncbi:MAG TPA: hypothetical protein PLL00_04665 [Bacteroidia bacterium]|nr:hypothetical protein [Bacteroidia bacterium]